MISAALDLSLLFREAETRLCINYLVDEERINGEGSSLLAVVLLLLTKRLAVAVRTVP